ncbi:hypothetical protein BXZ70DRAFT_962071 [Cristinia sonorae]|uniref:Uncharacterized protein n=1 Tax=Cristinia sonorae TaxID=1940300 RepID=A0A8K0UEP9_9AGAR|nr:hypothetical protein BXZ70DRAFT_962071 [Cristinia sonorae]
MFSNFLRKHKPPKEQIITIVQYERQDFTVGNEEELHWAIVVLPSDGKTPQTKGRSFQVIDRHYSDGRGTVWTLHDQEEDLKKTRRCLGGVQIGKVSASGGEYEELCSVLSKHLPEVKYEGWNCRSWVMEAVGLMREKGWLQDDIPDQAKVFVRMRRASVATKKVYDEGGNEPTLVSLN